MNQQQQANQEQQQQNKKPIIDVLLAILHTFIRFMPLGLYFFTYFSTIVYKDIRSVLLLIGLVINDLLNLLYKRYYKVQDIPSCSVLGSPGTSGKDAPNLPSTHTGYISFVLSFFVARALHIKQKDPTSIIFLLLMLFLTIYSRVAIGCKTLNKAVLSTIFGFVHGIIYYQIVSKWYNKAENETKEKNVCEYGYDNYRCATIQDGTVIVKRPQKDLDNIEKKRKKSKDGDNEDDVNDQYYDY